MYYAKYGNSYLHDPFTDDVLVSDLSISAKVNEKGSASFTMAPTHPLYEKIQLQDPNNSVYIYDDDTILFDGYVVDTSIGFDKTIEVSCDGALGYLEQYRIRPYATSKSDDDDPSTEYIGSTFDHYIEWIFDAYNERCDSWKQIKLGKNEATQLVTNNTIYRANSGYPTFAEEIEDKVLDSPGGYLFLRHEGNSRYVDYFKDCVDVNAQIIDFGVNLLDFTRSDETSDMATAIIPVGKTARYLVNGAEVEHMNMLEDTGGWTEDNKPSKWSINGGSEDNAVEMVTVDGLNCLHRIGSVGQQDTSLRLEWNTEYTWQCKIKFASSGTVENNNPIHCWCNYTNESSEMTIGTGALSFTYLKVEDLTTGSSVENVSSASVTANHWYLITQRFKTISQYSSYKYCLFRPWIANGLGNGEWWMSWMKLEKDVTPTDWTAFPEDAEMTEIDLTISNLGDGGTNVAGFYIEGDKVIYKPTKDVYGTIESQQDYSDIGDMDLLVTEAIADLINVARPVTTIEASAVDLSLISEDYKALAPGQLVRIRSKPHNVDEYMMLSDMSLDLSEPSNTTYTFGVTYDSLTGQQNKKIQSLNAAINKSLDSVASFNTDLINAAKDADKALTEAKKAYDATKDNARDFSKAISDLQNQVDGAIETWFYDHEPGNDVEPAKDWTTTEDKDKHLGDLYYNTATGYCYRWQNQNGVYSWSRIADTDVTKALEAAKNAQDTADHKRTIFVDTPTVPYEIGDLWVQGESGDILRCSVARKSTESYAASDWVLASKYTDDTTANEAKDTANSAVTKADNAQKSADQAISDAKNAADDAAAAQKTADDATATITIVEKNVQSVTEATGKAQDAADKAIADAATAQSKADEAYTEIGKAQSQIEQAEKEISNVDQKASDIRDALSGEITTVKNTMEADYAKNTDLSSTETTLRSEIETSAAGIKSTVAQTYATKTDLAATNTAVSTNATDLANAITKFDGDVSSLQDQIDGAIETWFYDGVPTTSNAPAKDWTTDKLKKNHLGDLYYDNKTGYSYRWQLQNSTYSWSRITDVDVTKALADAAKAQDTADNKRRVFVATPITPYDVGDLWVQGTKGEIMRCQTAKTSTQSYAASDWVKASKYTDDTAVTTLANTVKTTYSTKTEVEQLSDEWSVTSQSVTTLQADMKAAQTAVSKAQSAADAAQNAANAAQSDVDAAEKELATAKTNLSNLQTQSDASDAEIAAAKKRITDAETAVSAAKTAAATAQSTADAAKNNAADAQTKLAALTTRVSTAETDITANAEAIKLKASRTDLDDMIEGIAIGGCNLIQNSTGNLNNTTYWTTESGSCSVVNVTTMANYTGKCIGFVQNAGGRFYFSTNMFKHTNGQEYTLTFWAKSRSKVTFGAYQGDSVAITTASISSSGWTKFQKTYTASTTLSLALKASAATTVYIAKLKLESGNKATDWTPAPEDLLANAKTYSDAQLKVTADDITSSVSKTYATQADLATTNTNVTTAQNTANTAKTKADNAQSTADAIKTDLAENYYTTSQVDQKADSITSTVASTYETKDDAATIKTQVTQNATSISTLVSRADATDTLIRETSDGIEVGKSTDGSTYTGTHTLVGTNSFSIHDKSHNTLASFGATSASIGNGKNLASLTVGKMLNIETSSSTSYIITGDSDNSQLNVGAITAKNLILGPQIAFISSAKAIAAHGDNYYFYGGSTSLNPAMFTWAQFRKKLLTHTYVGSKVVTMTAVDSSHCTAVLFTAAQYKAITGVAFSQATHSISLMNGDHMAQSNIWSMVASYNSSDTSVYVMCMTSTTVKSSVRVNYTITINAS